MRFARRSMVCSIPRLLEDALALSNHGLERDAIAVQFHVADVPEVLTDKHKVLQIVLNLLRNARDAVRAADRDVREIHIHGSLCGPDCFEIKVVDNGIGLRAEDLQRVFQHGFTTKAGGHGFGLHSGALAAKDLGGRLTALSDGPGRGATFVLALPLRAPARNGGIEVCRPQQTVVADRHPPEPPRDVRGQPSRLQPP